MPRDFEWLATVEAGKRPVQLLEDLAAENASDLSLPKGETSG